MALITCYECGNKVSSVAESCPKCGYPVSTASASNTVTVEMTSKKFKMHKIICALAFMVGLIWTMVSVVKHNDQWVLGALIMFLSVVGNLITRFRVWWNHK